MPCHDQYFTEIQYFGVRANPSLSEQRSGLESKRAPDPKSNQARCPGSRLQERQNARLKVARVRPITRIRQSALRTRSSCKCSFCLCSCTCNAIAMVPFAARDPLVHFSFSWKGLPRFADHPQLVLLVGLTTGEARYNCLESTVAANRRIVSVFSFLSLRRVRDFNEAALHRAFCTYNKPTLCVVFCLCVLCLRACLVLRDRKSVV